LMRPRHSGAPHRQLNGLHAMFRYAYTFNTGTNAGNTVTRAGSREWNTHTKTNAHSVHTWPLSTQL